MPKDFLELKRKKERGVSNKEFMKGSYEQFKDSPTIVVVGMDKEGIISTCYTHSSMLEAVGLLEISKAQLIKDAEL